MGTIAYLLDTHTFLWAIRGSTNLSDTVVKIIEDTNTKVFVSAVSAYEIMNKRKGNCFTISVGGNRNARKLDCNIYL